MANGSQLISVITAYQFKMIDVPMNGSASKHQAERVTVAFVIPVEQNAKDLCSIMTVLAVSYVDSVD